MKSTRFLIRVGMIFVLFPTVILALFPAVFAFLSQEIKSLELTPIFLGFFLGLIASFLWYRFSVRRWIRWSFSWAEDPNELKRRAILNGIVAEKGTALIATESLLDTEVKVSFSSIDAWISKEDNSNIPQQIDYQIGNKWVFSLNAEGLKTSEKQISWEDISGISFRKANFSENKVRKQVQRVYFQLSSGEVWSIATNHLKANTTGNTNLEEVIPVMRLRFFERKKK